MKLPFANRSTLDRRLRRIDKELSTVSSDIHSLSRKAKKQGVETAGREDGYRMTGPTSPAVQAYPYRTSTGTISSGYGMVREATGGERWQTGSVAAPGRPQRAEAATALAERDSESDEAKARRGKLPLRPQTSEQFATYFMTGGLEQQGALRHERHVQRNKAIFMIFVLLLILFAVLFFIGH